MRDWRTWALLLPLGAALLRGVVPPIIKIGLEIWPSPIGAGLTGYIFSTMMVLVVERIRTGRFIVQAPLSGRLWFARHGICNGVGTMLLYAALGAGPVTLVAPLIATYPLVTVALSALVLTNVRITARLVAGTALAVGGVVRFWWAKAAFSCRGILASRRAMNTSIHMRMSDGVPRS